MVVFMKISSDKYELPLAVADSPRELEKLCGVTKGTVRKCIERTKNNKNIKCSYITVEIEEGENNE